MDKRIAELTEYVKEKYGLDGYELKRHGLRRSFTPFLETKYTLEMEWFPEGAEEDEYGSNPEGTAVIELDIESRKVEALIFVGGKAAQGARRFSDTTPDAIARWVEQETGLVYGEQFRLKTERERMIQFEAVLHGVLVAPPTSINVGWDEKGTLTSFMKGGYFPEPELAEPEPFTLELEQVAEFVKVKRFEMPDYEHKRICPYFTIKELNITQDGTALEFEQMDRGPENLPVNEKLYWQESSGLTFEKQPIEWGEEITPDQAFAKEASPHACPFSEEEVSACKQVLIDLLSSEYPEASGKWQLTAL